MTIPRITAGNQFLAAECLEGRRLLSADAPTALRVPVATPPDIVLTYEPAGDDDGDIELKPSQLPGSVADSLGRTFPGATLIEADYSVASGQPEYGVSAIFGGKLIGVTLAPDGRILESESVVTVESLPAEALESLQRDFPGLTISEVTMISTPGASGVSGFEVTFNDATGRGWEGALVLDAPVLSVTPTGPIASADSTIDASAWLADTGVTRPRGWDELDAGPVVSLASQLSVASEFSTEYLSQLVASAPTGLTMIATSDSTEDPAAFELLPGDRDQDESPLLALAPFVVDATWVPELAGALCEAVPFRVGDIEEKLANVLVGLESFVQDVTAGPTARGLTLQLAGAAATVAGARYLLGMTARRRRESPGRGPVLNASWSWVLSSPVAVRR